MSDTDRRAGQGGSESKLPARRGSAAIRIGALLDGAASPERAAPELLGLGLECFALSYWLRLGGRELAALAAAMEAALGGRGRVSALSVYGNVLGGDEAAAETLRSLEELIDTAPVFGAPVVGCFAGRLPGRSVPDSIEAWKSAFGPLAERAARAGVVLGLENCRMGDTWKTGKWNIAINPDAWELLFAALPGAPIGLEWEPAHQILALADPHAQLEAWAPRVVHVHAKDARIDRMALAERGVHGSTKVGRECLAGEGDTDWRRVFSILAKSGYRGAVDVELGADPDYRGGREAEGIGRAAAALFAALSDPGPA